MLAVPEIETLSEWSLVIPSLSVFVLIGEAFLASLRRIQPKYKKYLQKKWKISAAVSTPRTPPRFRVTLILSNNGPLPF
jgi:hypothetical protein